MVKIDPKNKWATTKMINETATHIFYKDNLGKIRSFRKDTPQGKDFIRFPFMENLWRWWRYKTPDIRMAIAPLGLSLFAGVIIYNLSMWVSERDVYQQEMAKLPVEFNKENLETFKQERKLKNEAGGTPSPSS